MATTSELYISGYQSVLRGTLGIHDQLQMESVDAFL